MTTRSDRAHIPTGMALDHRGLDYDEMADAVKGLRKMLRGRVDLRVPETVHKLRTRVRRVEALIPAVGLDERQVGKRLMKDLRPVHKVAGRVRDMDVMTGYVVELAGGPGSDEVIALLEVLGARRVEEGRALEDAIDGVRGAARRRLKRCRDLVEHGLDGAEERVAVAEGAVVREIAEWGRVNLKNLHEFRKKLKEMLDMAKVSGGADEKLLEALGEAKDVIGEWHDWSELAGVAEEVVGEGELLRRIRSEAGKKRVKGMALAREVRKRYFVGR